MNNNLLGTTSDQPQSQFRPVNLGDLNLLEEIDNQGVIERRPTHQGRTRTGSVTIQRIYKARIFGNQDPMTAIVYDGPKFEQRLAQARDKQGYRNPLLAQLFGFTRSAGVNALIYHDEMMTIAQIRGMHATSVLALLYLEREMVCPQQCSRGFHH
ncbi:hypothetical protein B0H19DRAFT_74521 [Mycena capillaripes]|nr:hypothetical protein B0H19DRAFT_74521 [Mycena capillaripes]